MNISNQNRITALYCRLSSEDENKGDSESIVPQKEILPKYAKDILDKYKQKVVIRSFNRIDQVGVVGAVSI